MGGWLGGRGDLSVGSMGRGWWTGGYSAGGEYVGGSRKRRRGGLHPSNGTREPLSNRCRGGARSPRWLLRTLMSFSLASPPPRAAPTTLASSTFDAAIPSTASLLRHLPRHACLSSFSASLSVHHPLRYALLPFAFPPGYSLSPATSFTRTPRGGHDTCQSTADARSIPTDLGFSLRSSTSFFALSSTTTLSSSTYPLHSTAEHSTARYSTPRYTVPYETTPARTLPSWPLTTARPTAPPRAPYTYLPNLLRMLPLLYALTSTLDPCFATVTERIAPIPPRKEISFSRLGQSSDCTAPAGQRLSSLARFQCLWPDKLAEQPVRLLGIPTLRYQQPPR